MLLAPRTSPARSQASKALLEAGFYYVRRRSPKVDGERCLGVPHQLACRFHDKHNGMSPLPIKMWKQSAPVEPLTLAVVILEC